MAQYTQILAQEYNDIQYTVTKVLGDKGYAIEPAFGYGITTSSVSVVAGQEIAATEWDLLSQDIRSAYWYQSSTDYGVPAAVVQGADIFWSNVVAYQNAANTVLSNAVAATAGVGQQTLYTNSQGLPGTSWPTPVVVDVPKSFTCISTATWTNATAMRQFFNAAGFLQVYWSVSGAPSVGTKNYAYKNVLTGATVSFTRANWIGMGGLTQQSSIGVQTQTYIIDSGGTSDGSPDAYTGTLPHKITRSCTVTMDCANSFVEFVTTVTDGATRTTYEGAVPAPKITLDTTETFSVYRPNGTYPGFPTTPIPGTRAVVVPLPAVNHSVWTGPT
jgi:hypothetical protein